MSAIAGYWKAIVAAVSSGLGAAGVALTDGHITSAEAIAIAIAVLAPGGVTWAVPNKTQAPAVISDAMGPGESGPAS